ncbi:hypothetical protein M0E87_10860 [Corynebacterium sp. CCM 9185]|nr:hypothetical protein [Corynebacterium marambiense]MCK7664150.1 hypothetical protein [Corynebacterium marambiense]MCX7543543.1 hypothetical protein [Corynebacterium marambiense]
MEHPDLREQIPTTPRSEPKGSPGVLPSGTIDGATDHLVTSDRPAEEWNRCIIRLIPAPCGASSHINPDRISTVKQLRRVLEDTYISIYSHKQYLTDPPGFEQIVDFLSTSVSFFVNHGIHIGFNHRIKCYLFWGRKPIPTNSRPKKRTRGICETGSYFKREPRIFNQLMDPWKAAFRVLRYKSGLYVNNY